MGKNTDNKNDGDISVHYALTSKDGGQPKLDHGPPPRHKRVWERQRPAGPGGAHQNVNVQTLRKAPADWEQKAWRTLS